MSRIPQGRSAPRSTPGSPKKTPSTSRIGTPRARPTPSPTPTPTLRPQASTKSLRSVSPTKTSVPPRAATLGRTTKPPTIKDEPPPIPKAPSLSVKEQIALKRAEAQKALKERTTNGPLDDFQGLEDVSPIKESEDVVDLGRWSIKETIDRARSTGAINLASRGLPCLPSALFQVHLNVTPEPLKSVPVEPSISNATSDEPDAPSRRRADSSRGPTWFEGKDLEILKAWSNEILEIQPEIYMFGSLKTIDLHNNKLKVLPDSIADLTSLAVLDLSHNELESLPVNLWAMPALTTLNISYNVITSLSFSAPFSETSKARSHNSRSTDDWYAPIIIRASTPLPNLITLDASHNEISSSAIDHTSLPVGLTKIDLSFNPLGISASLVQALSRLVNLQELRAECSNIADDSFPVDILVAHSASIQPFSHLHLLDVGETQVTHAAVEATFRSALIKQKVEFELTTDAPKDGTLRIIVGKKVVKEAWELEIERRTRLRTAQHARTESLQSNATTNGASPSESEHGQNSHGTPKDQAKEVKKEQWEIEAEQGLLTDGGKRRMRAMMAAQAAAALSLPASSATPEKPQPPKESWEIEAEQGLLTAGGRRRARAQAALAIPTPEPSTPSIEHTPAVSPSATLAGSHSNSDALSHPQHYNSFSKTLKLPPSALPSRANHARSFSLTPQLSPLSPSPPSLSRSTSEMSLAVPTPTLPLAAILTQSFADTLVALIVSRRRIDPSLSLPLDQSGPFLPRLEELRMDGCELSNTVPIVKESGTSSPELSTAVTAAAATTRMSEPLLGVITRLFPSLKILDLSYNHLTSDAFTEDVISALALSSSPSDSDQLGGPVKRAGLKSLTLRGNKISELDFFQPVVKLFKGYKDKKEVGTFTLEELDLRDNEIKKLPPELGLLPLDVVLVDGNLFRIPPRRVWEREGTRGLLSWLRGRIE